MVVGCGIDIEEHHRFKKFFDGSNPANFFLSIFTATELENYAKYNTHLCYAVSFSCKEAFYKAFGGSWDKVKIDWHDIELLFSSAPENGKAVVNFFGTAKLLAEQNVIQQPPSFSYNLGKSVVTFESILHAG